MDEQTNIVYGAWLNAIGSDKEAIVKLENERFLSVLRAALKWADGDLDRAMESVRQELTRELRRVL